MSSGLQLGRPGVYLAPPQRDPPRLRTVRLDVAGMVGVAPRGPVDTPVPITSWTEFERRFGGFDLLPTGTALLPYAVEAFFAQGGRRLWVVRVTAAPDSAGPGADDATACFTLDGGPSPRRWLLAAADEGLWGNALRVTLRFEVSRTITVPAVGADGELVTPTATGLADQSLCRVRRHDLPAPGVLRWVRRVVDPTRDGRVLRLDAPLPQAAAAAPLRLQVVTGVLDVVDTTPGMPRVERIGGLGLHPGHPRFLPDVLAAESLLLRRGDGWEEPLRPTPLLTEIAGRPERDGRDRSSRIDRSSFFDDDGADADPLDERASHRGVDAAGRVPELGILCVPDLTWRAGDETGPLDGRRPEDLAEIVLRQLRTVEVADLRRRFVALLDVPGGLSPEAVTDWRSTFSSSYAAAYHPWLGTPRRPGAGAAGLAASPPSARARARGLVLVPPSAYAAGTMAARERRSGLSRGPANELARGAVLAAEQPTEALADRLHLLGVNLFLPERDGFRLTAGRTLSADPEYRQLSVRRLMTMLSLVLERQLQWLVFEPGTAALRGRVAHGVTQLLRELHRQGAFAGSTEAESFFVRCDDTTNPPDAVAQGRLITEVGVAPAAPLEYLVLRIAADVASGVDVTEARRG